MNDAQVWTLIGVFAAGMASVIGLVLRIVSVEISSPRNEMRAEFVALRTEMNFRFEHLDRDIQALTNHVFPDR